MSFVGTVWGWFLLACPVAFIAGFAWIDRARELDEPIEGVPSFGGWLLLSLGSIGLMVVMGGLVFLAGMGHGSDSVLLAWVAMPLIIIGPIVYCVYAFKWMNRIRNALKAQRAGKIASS